MSFKKIYFSVITVTYQDEIGLKETLNSLSQFDNSIFEHIIIDGGSKYNISKLLKEYSHRIDFWISEKDSGLYDAMNKGLKLVSNKDNIVSFLNSGDIALSNYFDEPKHNFLQNKHLDYSYGSVIIEGLKKQLLYKPKLVVKSSEILQRMPFPHPALFVKKQIFLDIGSFNLNKKITADHEWCVRLIKSGAIGNKFNNPVVRFKLGGASLKLRAQFEVFQTALQYNRNIMVAIIFLFRQIMSHVYYLIRSKI